MSENTITNTTLQNAAHQKERDYMFDTFRGILMACIPLSHFTRVAGHFSQASLGGVVYITINVFVMQAFVFLSGYFSKKPDRSKETSFHTFMWPYLLGIPFFYLVRMYFFGNAHWNLDVPPFALWYLWAVFFYRYFTKEWMKVPHIMELSILVYLIAGQIPFLDDTLALGRMVSYFPFFVFAVYMNGDQLQSLKKLKKWHCAALAAFLIGCSTILAFCVPQLPVGFYLLKEPAANLGITWYWDVIGRLIILFLAWAWIILMFNILPSTKNYLSYIGVNTMPIYILHLIVRYQIKFNGIGLSLFKVNNWFTYYGLIFGLAALCSVVFSSKPVVKIYDFVVEGLWKVFCYITARFVDLLGLFGIPVNKIKNWVLKTIGNIK